MLTEDERREVEQEIGRCRNRREACVEALKIIQRHRGWISDEIRPLAELLGMTAEELDGVATFYPFIFRKPVGKHVVLICDSVSCWVMGYEDLLGHLSSRLGIGLGETTGDGQFTLLPASCLGCCDRAPAMMVDDELFTDLTAEKIDDILGSYR